MTLEQKIEHLKDAAMQEARAEGNAIMKQHEDALEGVFEQHRAEALRQSITFYPAIFNTDKSFT